MTTIFLYECITGGGLFSARPPALPTGTLLREGTAMAAALAEDLLRLPDTNLVLLHDARLPACPPAGARVVAVHSAAEERETLARLAAAADGTVLIAPEFDQLLAERARLVAAAGGRLLSPDASFVDVTADKHGCAERLRRAGIPVPHGICFSPSQPLPSDFPYPAVLKPCDGAGSRGLQWIAHAGADFDPRELGTAARLEAFCAGLPVSVAVLCGRHQRLPLPACRQRLSDDGRFRYLGGDTPLDEPRSQRAQRLALAALDQLPPAIGYVGLDLVLGTDPSGREDVVVEVNPRLTTSYVGLRQLACGNLAGAMLAVAQGRPVALAFRPGRVAFDADGRFTRQASSDSGPAP